ncbi:unnamed protein product [Ambrosiozyma monospora]|uniref:Unnamed protein product n=1 Tax=Ambrosiozyma monospora TaxID=43982 RepID=A0ACB5SV75_AMBMO|nr:unnamed protein product [Ambrosiozyma monospora]
MLKKWFASKLLNEIFYTLNEEQPEEQKLFSDYADCLSKLLDSISNKTNTAVINVLCDTLWALSNSSIVYYLLNCTNDQIKNTLLKIAIAKSVSLDPIQFVQISSIANASNVQYFAELARSVSFSNSDIEVILDNALEGNKIFNFVILKEISNKKFVASALEKIISSIQSISGSIEGLDFLATMNGLVNNKTISDLVFESSIKGLELFLSGVNVEDFKIRTYVKSLSLSKSSEVSAIIEKLLQNNTFSNNANLVFSSEFVDLLVTSPVESSLKTWYYRGVLYITKMYAEHEVISSDFFKFLDSLKEIVLHYPIWKYVPKAILNSQLEVVLSSNWVSDETSLKYINWVLLSGSKNVVEFDKHIQIFINNKHNLLYSETPSKGKTYSAMLLHRLITFNSSKVCNWDLQSKILKVYNGTLSADDLIIKDILLEFENAIGQSWADHITSWEFQDQIIPGETSQFISAVPDSLGLNITLSKPRLDYSVKHCLGASESFKLPELSHNINSSTENWNSFESFIKHNSVALNDLGPIYDNEFLLLLILCNNELFKFSHNEVDVDVKKLIDSGLMQFIVSNLANCDPAVVQISKRILYTCLLSLESQIKQYNDFKTAKEKGEKQQTNETLVNPNHISAFKDRLAFKVFLAGILGYLEDPESQIQPVQLLFLAHLVPILNNPGHFLYEKTFRYILGGSKIRSEIPLYKSVCLNFTTDPHLKSETDQPDFYKQLHWFASTLSKSLTSSNDLKLLNRGGILENLMNLVSSPFVSESLLSELLNIMSKVIQLPNGSDLLIRSYGLLSFLELAKNRLAGSRSTNVTKYSTNANAVLLKIQSLIASSAISSSCNGSDKRAREWCDDELERNVKRVMK